jgi:hypothetical protein
VIVLAGTLLAAASLSFSSQDEPRRLALLDVPFISQSEALCGGAAVSMVLRYWGDTGVRAEDFASLVDAASGGIRTRDLVSAVQARRSSAIPMNGNPALAQAELAAGRPVIALIEDRPGAFHYVVLVGWHERAVVFHDPARTPFVVSRPEDFERRWQSTRKWMLAVAPAPDLNGAKRSQSPGTDSTLLAQEPLAGTEPVPSRASTFNAAPAEPNSTIRSMDCRALVDDGVRLAQHDDLTGAERVLADATYRCGGAAPLRELAGVRLLQRRWPEVRELATQAVSIDASDSHAWRLLAASQYIGGDRAGALDAWNRAGEPVLDLVSASGLQRTSHRTVEGVLGLAPGAVLTRRAFERASRRLDELPAAVSTRVEYVARGGGTADVCAHVAEQTVVPKGRLTWAMIAARTVATRELALAVNSLSGRGERIEARWRFWPDRPAYGISLRLAPGSIGLLSLEGFAEVQPFTAPEIPAADRTGARVRLANWATGAVRWEVRGGAERWTREGTFGVVGAATRLEHRGAIVALGGDFLLGDTRFATGEVTAAWSSSRELRGRVVALRGGLQAIGASAPLALWPAGDTGHARSPLLRAHPVLRDGHLDVERLGRRVAHGGLEVQQWRRGPGPLALGIAGFLDTARTGRRFTGNSESDADAGVGLRVGIPGRRGLLRVDIAHGLRDGRNALSIAWQP